MANPPIAPRAALLERILDDVARHGLGDRSLRDLATAAGSSHRMLLYHFGSRDGLVAAIVDAVEEHQRVLMTTATADLGSDPADVVRAVWARVSAPDQRPFVQLFFETVAHASRIGPRDLTTAWLDDAGRIGDELGVTTDDAQLRLGVAVIRGLLVDVVAAGDIDAADRALEAFLAMWARDLRP